RYGDTPSNSETSVIASRTDDRSRIKTLTLGTAVHLTEKRSDDFRLGFSQLRSGTHTAIYDLIAGPHPEFNSTLGLPVDSNAEIFVYAAGVGGSQIDTNIVSSSVDQWNVRDTFSLQTGKHLLKMGFDERHLVSHYHPPALSFRADFLDRQS